MGTVPHEAHPDVALLAPSDTGSFKCLRFFIPWPAPVSPNRFRAFSTRQRMSITKAERDKAWLLAREAAIVQRVEPFTGPAVISMMVFRRRLLDPMTNLPASLKATVDGICRAVLPRGDGPKSGYTWAAPQQVQVALKTLEGVRVTITEVLR